MGMVDFSGIMSGGIISLPHFLPFKPEFNIGAIVSVVIIFLVSAAETIGDTTAMVSGGLNREITTKNFRFPCVTDMQVRFLHFLAVRRLLPSARM